MANTTALAAARHHVLAAVGWDVETDGLAGSPPIRLVVGDEVHVTIPRGARFLGLGYPLPGAGRRRRQRRDDAGRSRAGARRRSAGRPTIVCCQAGNVNTGALDPVGELAAIAHAHGAWLHVDGAIGLWAAASRIQTELEGLDQADSWSTDAHKWLNVPYDCGIVICRHHESHRAAMTATASYLVQAAPGTDRDPVDWNPEFSGARAACRCTPRSASLGREGIEAIVERCCAHARRFAELLAAEPGVVVLNDVVLNQVLVRFLDPGGTRGRSRRADARRDRRGAAGRHVLARRIDVARTRPSCASPSATSRPPTPMSTASVAAIIAASR